jgi:DNA-binding Xre family transcriptional regulator
MKASSNLVLDEVPTEATTRWVGHIPRGRVWSEGEVAMLGVLTDSEVAPRIGCSQRTVSRERLRRGLAAARRTYFRPDLFPLDGMALRRVRLRRGLTGTELGTMTGRNQSHVSFLENSKRPRIKPQTAQKLADALGCSLDELRRSSTNS